MKGKKSLFFIIIIALILMLIFKDISIAYCEITEEKETLARIKERTYNYLSDLIKQEDFKECYEKTWLYKNIILNEEFIRGFLEKIQWKTHLEVDEEIDVQKMLIKIGKEFNDYVYNLQVDWMINESRNHKQAWENAYSFCKNVIKLSTKFAYNNAPIIPWIFVFIITNKMLITTVPTDIPLLITTVQPLIDFAHILSVYKNLHIPNVIPNAIILTPANVQYYIITPTAWENFFASNQWNQIVSDNHTIYSSIIGFVIIVLTKYYFS